MHYFRFLSCVLIAAASVAITSCKVEGPAGLDGADGNANVKSQTITVAPSAWEGNGYVFQAQRPASIITADIVASGAILCYMQDGNTYIPLPFTFTYGYDGESGEPVFYNSHTLFTYSPGVITFLMQDDDGMTQAPTRAVTFKVVTIASSEVIAGLDTRNYREVANAFQLDE